MYVKLVLCALLVQCVISSKQTSFLKRFLKALNAPQEKRGACQSWEFACVAGTSRHDGSGCVFGGWKCDNDNDCTDGSDELNCPGGSAGSSGSGGNPAGSTGGGSNTGSACQSWETACTAGTNIYDGTGCVATSWNCDGESDCSDGSDEANCGGNAGSGGNTGGNTGGTPGTGNTGGSTATGGGSDPNLSGKCTEGQANELSQDDKNRFLADHNRVRAELAAQLNIVMEPLEWDDDLANMAQKLVNNRPSCNMGSHEYMDCSGTRLGQNLYGASAWYQGPNYAVEDAVKSWESEKQYWDWSGANFQRCSGVCGHYSQIIWADTKRVGCAGRTCGNSNQNSQVYVCDYYPPGNFQGQKAYGN